MSVAFSVVVPFHNAERHVERCVRALLNQSYPSSRYEIIMVDNNSRDASADIVRAHSRIGLVSESKRGAYAARNRGIVEASGAIVAFTDPDCVPAPDWLHELESAMLDETVGIVVGSHAFASDSHPLGLLAAYENAKKAYVYDRGMVSAYYGHANNMAIRTWLLEREGGFVETMRGSDTVFIRRCAERYAPHIVRYHRQARVRHLEIESVRRYLHKVFIYAQSSRRFAPGLSARPLSHRDRVLILKRVFRAERYPLAQSASLSAMLMVGLACWFAGGVKAEWTRWRR